MIFSMDNQLPSAEHMTVSEITAMANVKEIKEPSKSYSHIVILIFMILFCITVVGVSVINFEGFVTTKSVSVIHAQINQTQDVQKLTSQ